MKNKLLSLLLLLAPAFCFASQPTKPINFGGGVDHANTPTDIANNRAVDSRNVVGNIFGSITKRGGSELYISQAISTNPINSLYRASVDYATGTKKVLLMTTNDRIYCSTGDTNPVWKLLKSGLIGKNQHFSFANANGVIVMTGDALTDPVYKYDVVKDSFSELFNIPDSTEVLKLRAKFAIAPNGYLMLGNCAEVGTLLGNTTNYPSRVYYSLFNNISSFTWSRYINIRTDDGEGITGMTEKGGLDGNTAVIYKPSSISNINYRILNLQVFGGDITVDTVVMGFGCISPRALVNAGQYDIVPTKDGIVMYDGGRKTRLNVIDEIKPISTLIKEEYERTINRVTYGQSCAAWYPKKQLYVFSFNDPIYSPQGKPNRVFVYDLRTGEWWPFHGIHAESLVTYDGNSDDGSLYYGSSVDGYVYRLDVKTRNDDARREISLDTFDSTSTATWLYPQPFVSTDTVIEGTGSVKIIASASNQYYSSMTRMNLYEFGEWNDKSLVSRDNDFFSFKVKIASLNSINYLRMDLQYELTTSSFTTYFSSVTLSSNTMAASLVLNPDFSTEWGEIKIPISSFTIPNDWIEVTSQTVPFAKSLSVYGVRFVLFSVAASTVNIDDLRIVSPKNYPIDAYYVTKQFNLDDVSSKDFRQIVLSLDKSRSDSFLIDVFTNYGYFSNTINVESEIPKEIFVLGYKGTSGIARLKSDDFTFINSTQLATPNIFDYMNGVASADHMWMFDRVQHKLLLLDRNDFNVIVSSFGELGSGATNFDTVSQMALVRKDNQESLYGCDNFNNRIFRVDLNNDRLVLGSVYGEIGNGATNFFAPSGITCDQTHCWIVDDGNSRIMKLTISTFGYVSERKFDSNTIADSSIQNDGKYLYMTYNKVSGQPYFQEVVLEQRNKGDMSLVNRINLRPKDVVSQSTYTNAGDCALFGKYIYVSFTKDLSQTGAYYVQKRLKEDFSLVDEYQTNGTQFSILGDGYAYEPVEQSKKIDLGVGDASYIQLKYYDNGIADNTFTLKNYSIVINPKSYNETP